MTKPDFVYVTYIATHAGQDLSGVRRHRYHAEVLDGIDHRPGTGKRLRLAAGLAMAASARRRIHASTSIGKVVESSPPRRLVVTWARPTEADDDAKHSRVTFDIEPLEGGQVRLTVTHEQPRARSEDAREHLRWLAENSVESQNVLGSGSLSDLRRQARHGRRVRLSIL